MAELAHRFALSYRTEPLFPSAGIGQKGVEFAFDQDPKLGDLVTGRCQRLTRHERSYANFAGDGCKLFGIQAITKPNRLQPSHHAIGIGNGEWHRKPKAGRLRHGGLLYPNELSRSSPSRQLMLTRSVAVGWGVYSKA